MIYKRLENHLYERDATTKFTLEYVGPFHEDISRQLNQNNKAMCQSV